MRVLVGLSGGVDSAAAVCLLRQRGYDVYAATMLPWFHEQVDQKQAALRDKAEALAARLNVPWLALDMRQIFYDEVVAPFIEAYQAGLTPNPCVLCNRQLKFAAFPALAEAAFARKLDLADFHFEHWATGHYAQIETCPQGGQALLRARDLRKDQSYMMWSLSAEKIDRLLLPLGGLSKADCRALVAEAGIVIPPAEESQEICFIDGSYKKLLEPLGFGRPGYFRDSQGRKLGQHEGVGRFTVGQRKKLGQSFGERVVVLELHPESGDVILGHEEDLYVRSCELEVPNFCWHRRTEFPLPVEVSVRYQHCPAPALLRQDEASGRYILDFVEPERAPTPGQSAVFYQGDRLIGGAFIRPVRRFSFAD